MRRLSQRALIAVGGLLLLVTAIVLYVAIQLLSLRQGYTDTIETIEPRTARLLGVYESAERLSAAGAEAEAKVKQVAYPAMRDSATAAAAMQQDVRERLVEAGMSISGSQIRPRQQDEGFDRLRLDLTAEGNIGSLEAALQALEEMRPLIFITELSVKPARVSRRRSRQAEAQAQGDIRKVSARFELISLRLKL